MPKRQNTKSVRRLLTLGGFTASAALAPCAAWAAAPALRVDPASAVTMGAVSMAVAATLWAVRASSGARKIQREWSSRLSELEGRLEKTDAILSAHPGLALVWDEAPEDVGTGWGRPRVLGGPAALASFLTLVEGENARPNDPVEGLLQALSRLPAHSKTNGKTSDTIGAKLTALRSEGVGFSCTIIAQDGRVIEVEGRAAGTQAAVWLLDPATRSADESGLIGKVSGAGPLVVAASDSLETAPLPAWRRDKHLKLVWVNDAYAKAVGARNSEDAVKRELELDPGLRPLAEKARQNGGAVETRCTSVANGERRAYRVIETPPKGGSEPVSTGIAIDVSEADQAKSALKRHLEAHTDTLNHLSSAIAIFGPSGKLIFYNRSFSSLWRLADADLRGNPEHGAILEKLRERGVLPEKADFAAWKAEQLALYSDLEATAPADDVWSLPDGRTLQVARQRHPLGGVLIVFEDITDELRLKTRFNTMISVQRATLNNLTEGVAVFGSDGVLRLYNTSFQRLWGLEQDTLAKRPHFETLSQKLSVLAVNGQPHWARLSERITSLSPDHRKPIEDAELELNDGRVYQYTTEPLPDGATLLSFRDVTDSKMRERVLEERNQILLTKDQMKSAFVNHVSYQLRTPLNTIIGFSELLESQMFGDLNVRQREYAEGVLTASHQLLDLINDIIDLATIEAGKMSLELGDVDVEALLEGAKKLSALKAEDTQVSLAVDCPEDIGVIRADERRLKQVLFNLLSNAFAFTGAGGKVTIGARRAQEEVQIFICDNGRGIDARDQARAFDRFEGRGSGSGAGLGLALVRSFVELHGGWVAMRSTPNVGTTVVCHLPNEAAHCATQPELGVTEDVALSAAPAAE